MRILDDLDTIMLCDIQSHPAEIFLFIVKPD